MHDELTLEPGLDVSKLKLRLDTFSFTDVLLCIIRIVLSWAISLAVILPCDVHCNHFYCRRTCTYDFRSV